MPLYEYQCTHCGERFEVMQKFSDEPLTEHESCGGKVERLLSAPALQFKGSGWYITDYGRSGGAKSGDRGSHDSKPEKKAESKAGEKSESKPATTTPASTPKS